MDLYFESRLIELVKTQPILYDLSHKMYKNNSAKKIAWDNLAQQLDLPSKEVQAKWRNMRKRFSSAIQEGRSGDAPKIINKKNAFLVKEMDFFRKYFQDTSPTVSNFEPNCTVEPDTNLSNSPFQQLLTATVESLDEIDFEEISFTTPSTSKSTGPAAKRKKTTQSDPVLVDLLDTMKGHNQLISQKTPQPPCKCQNIDQFFISAGEEFKNVGSKFTLEAKIGIMNTIKLYVDKTQESL